MLNAVQRPREQLAEAGIKARALMEAEFDEAIVVRAYLSCLGK